MTLTNATRYGLYALATLGLATVLLLISGSIADVLAFDRTSDGHEPPYTEYSGEPIDWDEGFITPDGIYSPGIILGTHVDCTSGMISFDIFGLNVDYRELSERALAVHEPREACEERGFSPEF